MQCHVSLCAHSTLKIPKFFGWVTLPWLLRIHCRVTLPEASFQAMTAILCQVPLSSLLHFSAWEVGLLSIPDNNKQSQFMLGSGFLKNLLYFVNNLSHSNRFRKQCFIRFFALMNFGIDLANHYSVCDASTKLCGL